MRCVTIELRETEIEALIKRGYLVAESRMGVKAIKRALYEFLDRHLGTNK